MAYPTVFPTSIDSYTLNTDGVDDVMAADVNELQSAIVAIETKLGTGQFHAAAGDGATWGFKAGAALDVLLYRGAADTWRTPDTLIVDTYLGAGTTSPLSRLHGMAGSPNAVTVITVENSDITSNITRGINVDFIGRDTAGNQKTIAQIQAIIDQINANDSHLALYTRISNTLTNVVSFQGGATTLLGAFGCNGATAQTRLTVTGSRGANAALASLLTQLVAFGLITDSTS